MGHVEEVLPKAGDDFSFVCIQRHDRVNLCDQIQCKCERTKLEPGSVSLSMRRACSSSRKTFRSRRPARDGKPPGRRLGSHQLLTPETFLESFPHGFVQIEYLIRLVDPIPAPERVQCPSHALQRVDLKVGYETFQNLKLFRI